MISILRKAWCLKVKKATQQTEKEIKYKTTIK